MHIRAARITGASFRRVLGMTAVSLALTLFCPPQEAAAVELPFGPRNVIYYGAPNATAYHVVARDVNMDEKIDIVGLVGKNIVRCAGNGLAPPSFSLTTLATGLSGARAVFRAADIDRDNDVDLAVADSGNLDLLWYENVNAFSGVFLKRSAGNVSFAHGDAVWVVAADFHRDQRPDLLASYHSRLLLFENYPTVPASFRPRTICTFNGPAPYVLAADIDADDITDIVASYPSSLLLYKNGFPSAGFTTHTVANAGAGFIAAADMDKDGRMDIVGQDLWFRNAGGSPPRFTAFPMSTYGSKFFHPVDLDRDGDMDVLACNDSSIVWLENNGSKPPEFVVRVIEATGANSLYAHDLDGDGDRDVIAASGNSLVWYENKAGLRIKSARFVEGSGDGVCQPGESGQLHVEIENSAGAVPDAVLSVTSASLPLRFASSTVNVGAVEAFSSRTVMVPFFSNAASVCGSELAAKLRLAWNSQRQQTPEFAASPQKLGALYPSSVALEDATPSGESAFSRTLKIQGTDGLTTNVRVTFTVKDIYSALGTTVTLRAPGGPAVVLYKAAPEPALPGVPARYYSVTQTNDVTAWNQTATDGDYVLNVEASGKIVSWTLAVNYGYYVCEPVIARDLALSKTVAPNPVVVGSNLTYSLTAYNHGTVPATGVTVQDVLPAGVAFVSAGATQGSVSETSGTVTAKLGMLDCGASAKATIVVIPQQAATVVNSAAATMNESDSNPQNNSASVSVTVQPPATPDLTGAWGWAKQTCKKARGVTRCQLRGRFTVQNAGTATAGASKLFFYLSEDGSYDESDTLLRQMKVGALRAKRSKAFALAAWVPAGTSASGKYVIAVADAESVVAEFDEANNYVVFGPLP